MYRYDEFDTTFVRQRVDQFRDQVDRRVSGELTEEQFRPLRLMNGLYLQLHAYMLRVAVPYGTLNSRQMRKLAFIADEYDKGYGHFTTRQNIQYNWPKLPDVPNILDHLADVEMHAIQTSGNCIRNVTADQWAGAAGDEVEDPRPYAELMRQWSSLHPEFSFLPRKFKIAVTGAASDRAAIAYHDIGLRLTRSANGEIGFEVLAGGGMGRTPMLGVTVRDWLPKDELLAYLEAIMRVYNLHGRRDNKYKARIKILVHELGAEEFTRQVEEEYKRIDAPRVMPPAQELVRIKDYFAPPVYEDLPDQSPELARCMSDDADFAQWVDRNVVAHKQPGYAIVNISLKPVGGVPGDASSGQMRAVADLAEQKSHDEIRVTHEQNLVLPHVRKSDLYGVWQTLKTHGLADANIGLATDIISCPGLDYCALATARSIPISQDISRRLGDISRQRDIGDLKIKISGCINACGHHHAGHIGILGLEKRGEEYYQITLGGSGDETASIGEIIGPGFSSETVTDAVETIVDTYVGLRQDGETFLDAYRRLGPNPFKEAVYATH
ncbi:MAG: nitrite/sulfite reductase [Hyphomicrobiaceae bacterium]|nr:nitrite/sulfite reductase [Hyphomicrobiaceae bacterium]